MTIGHHVVNQKLESMNVEAVMFDLDGTLIDSIPAYFKILEIILEEVQLPPVKVETVRELMKGGMEAWEALIPKEMMWNKDELRPKIIESAQRAGKDIFMKEVKLLPGVCDLFEELFEKKIKIGIVTSSFKRTLNGKLIPLRQKRLDQLVDTVISIDDVPTVKPASEPLLACAQRMKVSRRRSVYVGDSYVDIRAGRGAGMVTVGVLTGIDDYETLKKENPDLIVKAVSDLRDTFYCSGKLSNGGVHVS